MVNTTSILLCFEHDYFRVDPQLKSARYRDRQERYKTSEYERGN